MPALGRGEQVTPLSITEKLYFLLLCPHSSVSAGSCYREYDRLYAEAGKPKNQENYTKKCIDKLLQNDVNEGGRYVMNDLYLPAASLNADVKTALEEMQSFSPIGATMTGSGSAVLGVFETKELCEWAKSRYHGKFRAYVAQTLQPDYERKQTIWRNFFILNKDELY